MKQIFKRFFLFWIILFSSFLWADGEDIGISITDASSVYESDGEMSFTIQLSEAPDWGDEVIIYYQTHNGSAKAGEDFIETNGSVTFYGTSLFPPHSGLVTSKTITVDIIDDANHEDKEDFYVKIINSTVGYSVTDDKGDGIIYDDDALPVEARVYNRWEKEKDSNWGLDFTVRLNQKAPEDITLHYQTLYNNSAVGGEDYIESNGTVTVYKDAKDGYIPITIIGDKIPETHTENFKVKISSISKGSITRDIATGTIVDDDAIRVDIQSSNVNEGNSGDHNSMPFKIFLAKDYPLDSPLTINYTTQDGSDPSATESSDYNKKTGSVIFNKGDKEKIIDVPIIGDDDIEPNENLKMVISGSSYIINDGESESEIINDDGEFPILSFSATQYSIIEGNSSQKNLNFTFTLNKPALSGSYFQYQTYDSTAKTGDNDYIATNGEKYLEVNTTTFTISVPIKGDTKIEEDESFYLEFFDLKKLKYGNDSEAEGIILNDDGSYPTLSFSEYTYSIEEGNSSQKDLNFTLSLDAPALEDSHFDYRTTDSSATHGEDYVGIPRTTYPIPKGEQNITITVKINGDTNIEKDEKFYLRIDNESDNLHISGSQKAKGLILNDDGRFPIIDINSSSYTIVEGNSSQKNIRVELKLDSPALSDSSIKYYTSDGSAQDGSKSEEDTDYIRTKGTLSIEVNTTTAYIDIPIIGDTLIEPNEYFKLYIRSPKNMFIGRGHTVINIINDDVHSNDPFECNEYMYISSSRKRGSKETGKMWLHRIDTTQNPFKFEVMDDEGEEHLYNAIAYNPDDNYIYGLYYNRLIRLTKSGKVIDLGEIAELPDRFKDKQLFAGAINNGYYFVTGRNSKKKYLFKIKLSDMSVEEMNLTKEVAIQDFSFYNEANVTKYLYGIDKNGKLTKIDSTTGDVSFIGNDHTGYKFDSSFSDKNGRFFANDSKGKGFFEFDLTTGEKSFISSSQKATYNDGANCINASLVFTDYGDAPSSYGKPRHDIRNGLFMGDGVDHDIDAYYSIDARGDDTNDRDDEDGVTLIDGSDINGTYFELNATQELKIKVSKEGYLNGWIDYNIDGDFGDAGEQIFTAKLLTAGTHTISFDVPFNITKLNEISYIRFRFSSTSSINSTESASDGEVEDYAIKFGTPPLPLKGIFNIERIGSKIYPINSDLRNAWYTQIAGRDFDYSLVFYNRDFTAEQNISDVTAKIELYDNIKKSSIYERYIYIPKCSTSSRFNFDDYNSPDDDLSEQSTSSFPPIPATKDAIFKISYGVDTDGVIIQSDCEEDPRICYERFQNIKTDIAKDNFAIRPDNFLLTISDNSIQKINSQIPPPNNNLRMASGYDYNLTIRATRYISSTPAIGYDKNITAQFDFNSTAGVNTITTPITKDIRFNYGLYSDINFTHYNVGKYLLKIPTDTTWTLVDQNKSIQECIPNSGERLFDKSGLLGCSIITDNYPIEMIFMPHHFDIDLNITNLPKSTHDNFVYMSEVNSTYADTTIAFQGKIVAKTKDGNTTRNFTTSCVSQDINFSIDADSFSDRGLNTIIKTANNKALNFVRAIKYNSDVNFTIDKSSILANLSHINLPKELFLDENDGSVSLDIRFNIDKNLTAPTNPIQINFQSIGANSTSAYSVAEGVAYYIPKGTKNINKTKNFYYARVVSDLKNYPRVNMTISPFVRTPLNVDIFCKTNVIDFCKNTNVLDNTNIAGTTREQNGWYLSIRHNADIDGNVTKLTPTPPIVTITPNPNSDIKLKKGKNGLVTEKFINCNSSHCIIKISTDPALRFDPSEYTVNCTDKNASQWTGIGRTGNILNVKPKINESGKMDW